MEVRLTKGHIHELNPDKSYLLFLKKDIVTEDTAKTIKQGLEAMGVTQVLVVLAAKNSYKLVEANVAESKLKKEAAKEAKIKSRKEAKEKSKKTEE